MKLGKWVETSALEWDCTVTSVYESLSEASGVSTQTISSVARGARMNRYDLAKAISVATQGAVTVEELCE